MGSEMCIRDRHQASRQGGLCHYHRGGASQHGSAYDLAVLGFSSAVHIGRSADTGSPDNADLRDHADFLRYSRVVEWGPEGPTDAANRGHSLSDLSLYRASVSRSIHLISNCLIQIAIPTSFGAGLLWKGGLAGLWLGPVVGLAMLDCPLSLIHI